MDLNLKNLIEDSKKIRIKRGEDYFSNKKENLCEVLRIQEESNECNLSRVDFREIRDSHVKLSHLIIEYDKRLVESGVQKLVVKKTRSRSVHLYVDEKIEEFLNVESKKSHTHWGLRKNAGLGSLIKKFILNFIELKERERKQIRNVEKIINEFRENLVEFKKKTSNPDDYIIAEKINQKMKALSNDLLILLSLLEFEDGSMKKCLGDNFKWLDFIIRWKNQ